MFVLYLFCKRIGMDYERALFGMKIFEARYLARMFRMSQTLVKVTLQANMIDDELVKVHKTIYF